MPAPRDPGTLMRAAHLYYINGKSQAEIATLLETSRSNVSRMLTEAQRQGIVEIRINDPSGRAQDLEVALQKTFGLQDVLVAQRGAGGAERIANQVGALAAQLLSTTDQGLDDGRDVLGACVAVDGVGHHFRS